MVTALDRYKEWRALLDWCFENREELGTKKVRCTALAHCLKRHWRDYLRLDRIETVMKLDIEARRGLIT